MRTSAVVALLGAGAAIAGSVEKRALQSITVKGNAFFSGSDRFYIRGVDYQPGGSSKLADPIADPTGCKRDIAEFTKLGINTVRIYTVDNTADHDECMTALADAGIYLVLDVNTPFYSLNRADPAPSYNDVYLQSLFATIDAFHSYPNTLAFFSGNEVVNDGPSSSAAPYVKAVTRDLRQYIRARGYRTIPVGYSAADIDTNRLEMAEYMNCGSTDERSDFFAFNDYSWCDPSSFQISGWDQKVKNFTGYGLPIFLSEYGCNTNTRKFEEVAALYNSEMTSVYSGGLVYEYSEEGSNYGLVQLSGDSVTELADFSALMSAFAGTASPTGDGGYNTTGGASGCPAYSLPNWNVTSNNLPTIPAGAVKYMTQGAGTGPGLTGAGSQNAGGASTGTATSGSGGASVTGSSATSSATSSGAAAAQLAPAHFALAPIAGAAIVVVSTIFGATLL